MSYPQFYIWNISYIIWHSFTFIPHGLELIRTQKWPAPTLSGFIAHLVRTSHWHRDVTASNSVEVLSFSGFYIRNCINCVHNCKDYNLLDFTSAVQYMKHFINHLTLIPHGLIRTNKWPAPNVSGLIAQLVRASHQSREVTCSNPVEVLTFSVA